MFLGLTDIIKPFCNDSNTDEDMHFFMEDGKGYVCPNL